MTCAGPVWCSGHGLPVSVPCRANVARPFAPARGTGRHGKGLTPLRPRELAGGPHPCTGTPGTFVSTTGRPVTSNCWQETCCMRAAVREGTERRCWARRRVVKLLVCQRLFLLGLYLRWFGRRHGFRGVAARAPSSLSRKRCMCAPAQFCPNV